MSLKTINEMSVHLCAFFSRRALALAALLAVSIAPTVACGSADTLRTFDVSLTTLSDCSQVGQGAVSCEDPEALAAVSLRGQWIFDDRGGGSFVVTTDEGRAVPGLFFANDGATPTPNCTGQGGQCYFARTRTDEFDVETNCSKIRERVIDVFIADDGSLQGELSDVQVTDDTCGTSLITEVRVQVVGNRNEEPVAARGAF